jgi:nicotinate-nucleotide adenylyltransferase
MRESVGIFGGAFDPIHKGHTKSLLEIKNLINFSELKIIPCGLPSQKDKTEASNQERLSMLEMTFRGHQNIKIDPIEIEKKKYLIYC